MKRHAYGISTQIDLPYAKAVPHVIEELKKEGFGVLTEIDVKATMKKKLDVDMQKYIILGACNPNLAHQALNKEIELGLFLPCNVIVYEADGKTVVSVVDPLQMVQMTENPALQTIADEANARLTRVVEALEGN